MPKNKIRLEGMQVAVSRGGERDYNSSTRALSSASSSGMAMAGMPGNGREILQKLCTDKFSKHAHIGNFLTVPCMVQFQYYATYSMIHCTFI
jgi:hypothetical protein